VATIPQAELEFGSLWMMKSMNNLEIISWLKQVRANAPEPAFRGLYMVAADTLATGRWQKIREALEDVVVA
jgi:hypothetical protein